jgi:hypothetical protein
MIDFFVGKGGLLNLWSDVYVSSKDKAFKLSLQSWKEKNMRKYLWWVQ